jgi:hypothetical protein
LALFPLGDSSDSDVLWAPEVEYAELEAYKLAGQVTFGTAFRERYIHGTQFIAEYLDERELWELSLLYVAGSRFSNT